MGTLGMIPDDAKLLGSERWTFRARRFSRTCQAELTEKSGLSPRPVKPRDLQQFERRCGRVVQRDG